MVGRIFKLFLQRMYLKWPMLLSVVRTEWINTSKRPGRIAGGD
jgi:hypothetical protein